MSADATPMVATSIAHQTAAMYEFKCDLCAAPYAPGLARLADSPGACATCALQAAAATSAGQEGRTSPAVAVVAPDASQEMPETPCPNAQ